MVYCGIPSKACFPCRSRRTKCDLIRPSCTQCKRTGRSCKGYRDSSSLQIRDESEAMAAKYSAQTSTKKVKHDSPIRFPYQNSTLGSTIVCTSRSQKRKTSHFCIPQSLCVLPEDAAACFFFGDYVLGDSKVSNSMFDTLPLLYSQAPTESATSFAIIALGIACLSITLNTPEVMKWANLKYVKALRIINSALKCPILSRTDETLMVVILLGLYEENNITSRSLDPWNHHLAGAIALLDLRGEAQFLTTTGHNLMSGLRFQAIANALVRRVSVPEQLIKWSRVARAYGTSEQNAESKLAEIMAEYCDLQITVENCDGHRERLLIIERALEIDIQLFDWATAHQIANQFSTIVVSKPSTAVFGDHWHQYGSIFMAAMSNHYRTVRILLNTLLVTHLSLLFEDAGVLNHQDTHFTMACKDQVQASKVLILELAHDLCSSVPYYLGDMELIGDPGVHGRCRRAYGKLLVWPLMVVGQALCVPDSMKSWVIGRLEILANVVRIHKAGILAKMLRAGVYSRRVWREQVPEEIWDTENSCVGR